ncbi:hypothetical protein [Bradyrhizobium sp. SYSU BS000235]|uniref:hypothetical protein n=1 Tax=Bradyrhizobium sp. SYSU BS000235 TaxID=3411332 RepID=UPI003C726B0D
MNVKTEISDWHSRTVRAWLLALLRFTTTLDADDKLAVFAAAAEIDRLGARHSGPCGFRFFHRTSVEVCAAVENPRQAGSIAVLRRHLERIKDERIKRAFVAVLELEEATTKPKIRSIKARSRDDLWKGLRC